MFMAQFAVSAGWTKCPYVTANALVTLAADATIFRMNWRPWDLQLVEQVQYADYNGSTNDRIAQTNRPAPTWKNNSNT